MVLAYANSGRFSASSAGRVPNVANCSTVPSRLYGLAGQPGILTTVFPFRISCAPTAPVGLGAADGTPPHDAHEPIAITAPAWLATSVRISAAVRPPIMQ